MLYKNQSRLSRQQKFLDLDSGEEVNIVQGFIPEVKVSGFTQASGDQDLFLLPAAEIGAVLSSWLRENPIFRSIAFK